MFLGWCIDVHKDTSLLILRGRAGQIMTQAREQDIETEAFWMSRQGKMHHRQSYIKAWTQEVPSASPCQRVAVNSESQKLSACLFQALPGVILLPCVSRILLALCVHSTSKHGFCSVHWYGKLTTVIYNCLEQEWHKPQERWGLIDPCVLDDVSNGARN